MDPSPLILPPAYRIGPEVFIESINLDFFPWHSKTEAGIKECQWEGYESYKFCVILDS